MALRRIWGASMAAGGALLLLASPALAAGHSTAAAPPPAGAGSSAPATPAHDDNRGRVWLEDSDFDNGDESQFQCGDGIRILGSKMADSSGTWTVVSWSPTDSGFRRTGTWTYDQAGPDRQVIAVVGSDLPAGHYRLDVEQKNTKHKMFWVAECPASGAVGATGETQGESAGASPASATGEVAPANASGEVAPANASGEVAPANASGEVAPANATGEVESANATAGAAPANATGGMPNGNVLAAVATALSAAQGGVLAATGTPVGLALIALGLIGLGGLVLVLRRRAAY